MALGVDWVRRCTRSRAAMVNSKDGREPAASTGHAAELVHGAELGLGSLITVLKRYHELLGYPDRSTPVVGDLGCREGHEVEMLKQRGAGPDCRPHQPSHARDYPVVRPRRTRLADLN